MTLIEGTYWFDVAPTSHKDHVVITIYERREPKPWRKEFKRLGDRWFSEASSRYGTIEEAAKEWLDEFLAKNAVNPWTAATVDRYGTSKYPIS